MSQDSLVLQYFFVFTKVLSASKYKQNDQRKLMYLEVDVFDRPNTSIFFNPLFAYILLEYYFEREEKKIY